MAQPLNSLKVGDPAPHFSLPDQENRITTLSQYLGKKDVVLFFYPKDYTPICTLESIAFRELYHQFAEANAEVLGLSSDPPESHASFCDQLKLPFRLLTDAQHRVRDQFGARTMLGTSASRVTYVIDKKGIIRGIFVNTFAAARHANDALALLKNLT